MDTINFNRSATTFYPKDGGRPRGTSTFTISRTPSAGADVFMYNLTNTVIDSKGGHTTTTSTVLDPEDNESAHGLTFGLNLYLDGVISTQRNNNDWESIGKLMYSDPEFKKYMLSRNPKSADWLSKASSMQVMEGLMPVSVTVGLGGWIGLRLSTPVASLGSYGSDEAILLNAANNTAKRGWYDVIVHGSADGKGFVINGAYTTPAQLYSNMLADGYIQGTRIRLMSCYSGSLTNGAAAEMSVLTNAQVMAPSGALYLAPKGSFMVNYGQQFYIESSALHETGKMFLFKP